MNHSCHLLTILSVRKSWRRENQSVKITRIIGPVWTVFMALTTNCLVSFTFMTFEVIGCRFLFTGLQDASVAGKDTRRGRVISSRHDMKCHALTRNCIWVCQFHIIGISVLSRYRKKKVKGKEGENRPLSSSWSSLVVVAKFDDWKSCWMYL